MARWAGGSAGHQCVVLAVLSLLVCLLIHLSAGSSRNSNDHSWERWGQWSECNVTCGGGVRLRSRQCVDEGSGDPADNSQCRGASQDTRICNPQTCRDIYSWERWGQWSECNVTCGGGVRLRSRSCRERGSRDPADDSQCQGSSQETDICNPQTCRDIYSWERWGQWSECNVTCGGGVRLRSRSCRERGSRDPADDSQCQGSSQETDICNLQTCRDVYSWERWGQWSECNVTCGGGVRLRSRSCRERGSRDPADDSQCQGSSQETDICNPQTCRDIYSWERWGQWSECNVTCGGGVRLRSRSCRERGSRDPADDSQCQGSSQETDICNPQTCRDVYSWERWGQWSECNVTCGGGVRLRSRSCRERGSRDPADDSQCQGSSQETDICNPQTCRDVYSWERWGQWSECNVTCGGGVRLRSRSCRERGSRDPADDSRCQGSSQETDICNPQTCRDVYSWERWGQWSECNVTCGGGVRLRSRSCRERGSRDPADDSQCQGSSQETDICNPQTCRDVYSWERWGQWSECNVTCGGGVRLRSRSCRERGSRDPADDSQCQGSSQETDICNPQTCRDVYSWERWGQWSECNVTCGGGVRLRSRSCRERGSRDPADDSQCQGSSQETDICNPQTCRDVYSWERWGQWSECNVTCGGGVRLRSRSCRERGSRDPADDSQCQGSSQETDICNPQTCRDVYSWERWGQWSECNVTCGGGVRLRSRSCRERGSRDPADDSQCQGSSQDTRSCNPQTCRDTRPGQWGQWTACSASCGRGRRSRARICGASQQCRGSTSDDRICFRPCDNLSKPALVEQLRPDIDADRLVQLETWAHSTQRVKERLFSCKGLEDHVITGHVTKTFQVQNRTVCMSKCLRNRDCRSFNLQTRDEQSDGQTRRPGQLLTCELNSVSRDDAISDLEPKSGFILYDVTTYVPFMDEDGD